MKNKKILKTKKRQKLMIMDVIMVIACLLYADFLLGLFIGYEPFMIVKIVLNLLWFCLQLFTLMTDFNTIIGILATTIMIFVAILVIIIIFTFPIGIICFAIQKANRLKLKEKTVFESVEEIEYFREKFANISPSTISLVADLEIEYEKDITATIMKLYQNHNIDFQDNNIVVINNQSTGLKETESAILNKLCQTKVTTKKSLLGTIDKVKWKKLCIQEAEREGFISRKEKDHKIIIKLIGLILLFIASLNIFLNNEGKVNQLLEESDILLEETEERDDKEYIKEIFSVPESKELMIVSSVTLLTGGLVFTLPIYTIVYLITYNKRKNKLKRTRKGKKFLEQIYGMKNFIHDFSSLDDSKKEQIKLWDEFLIYAILLEENSKIIEEVSAYKSVKIINEMEKSHE